MVGGGCLCDQKQIGRYQVFGHGPPKTTGGLVKVAVSICARNINRLAHFFLHLTRDQ